MWSPAAHAEINKMKVLEFFTRIYVTVPTALPFWYEEALRDEEERSQARIETMNSSTAIPGAYYRTKFNSFCEADFSHCFEDDNILSS
ncbi:hypothetical protein E2I00_002153 [Balaenoptera physalus]|uniref:MAGE domain-containing protein n=1 Tax=Balaenoptera physalus TaxID=9770 RepID=A0A6A1Q400_BALPH|nr:hypothetical protein E2I00_002153 [Balaenoptera physalus]